MANPTTNFGWQMPQNTDLVKDLPADFEVFGQAVDTDLADLKGGTTGQILSKTSNTDLDFTWINNDQGDITEVQAGTGISVASGTGPVPVITNTVATEFDAKGDLIVGTGSDTFDRLAVGTDGYTLVADSSTSTGLKWTAASAGKLLQVINADTDTVATSSSSTYIDTNLSASITPSSSASKILITIHQAYNTSTSGVGIGIKLYRGATELKAHGSYVGYSSAGGETITGHFSISYLDSPNTTSATTYKTQFARLTGAGSASVQNFNLRSYITLMEIGA